MEREIILPSFRLERIHLEGNGHIQWITTLNQEEECQKYLGNLFRVFEKDAPPSYIFKIGTTKIGFLQIETSQFQERELTYALHPRHQHRGYASRLVEEVSDFLLERECETVSLKIEPSNLKSICVALNAGFELQPRRDYRYYEFIKKK